MIADYELGESLGRGNHGQFFKAVPPARLGVDDEWVAIKVLDRNANDDEFRRFANELQLLASVNSPHLVPILDAGQQNGTLFYVTEFCVLGSLGAPGREMNPESIITAVAGAARGADALHAVGVAHRDIKPTNVLLTSDGGRLADLGLAQVLNPGQTVTGFGPIGSIEYMAPAIVRGEKATRASDLFSLAATLHKALCGESIFGTIPADDVLEALRHVLRTEPTVSKAIPEDVAELIESCIGSDGGPDTAAEFASMLEAMA